MKLTPQLSNLTVLARDARRKVEALSNIERGDKKLRGYCGIASAYLHYLSNQNDINTTFVCGHFLKYNRITEDFDYLTGHAWVECEDYIIDITATQFVHTVSNIERDFNKKVYISKYINPHYRKILIEDSAISFTRTWHAERFENTFLQLDQY